MQYKILNNLADVEKLLNDCAKEQLFCFDFETTGLEWYDENELPTIMSVSYNLGYSYIIPLYHFDSPFTENQCFLIWQWLKNKIFENKNVIKIGHNIKFDLHWIMRFCTQNLKGQYHDTLLQHHLLDEINLHGLKELVSDFFPDESKYEDEVGKYKWNEIPLELLSKYAGKDTDFTLRFYIWFTSALIEDDEESRLYILYRNLTMPSLFHFLYAEHHGALIDKEYIIKSIEFAKEVLMKIELEMRSDEDLERYEMIKLEQIKEAEIQKLNDKIENCKRAAQIDKYELKKRQIINGNIDVYEGMNFNSPKQLTEFLFSENGLALPLYYDTQKREHVETTNADALKTYTHDFIDNLISYRSVSKMISTYYEGILERLDLKNYIHSSFLIHGTTTGRISSKNPNLQNIPNRVKSKIPEVIDVFKRVKKFFICLEGYEMIQGDFSGAELKTIANISGDETMRNAFLNGLDLHAITGAKILGITLEELMSKTEEQIKKARNDAKGANFGLMYGAQEKTYLQYFKDLTGRDITPKDFIIHRDAIFKTYKRLDEWHTSYINKGRKFGYVRTLFGRKRRLPNIKSDNNRLRSQDERLAINSPVQGTSGEWTLFTIVLICKIFNSAVNDDKATIFFNSVHDSMFFYVKKQYVEMFNKFISPLAAKPPLDTYFGVDFERYNVPMLLDLEKSSTSWGQMEKIK